MPSRYSHFSIFTNELQPHFIFQCLAHTLSFDGTFMDTIIECARGVLSNPMIGELLLEYYKMVETDLCNRALATVQHLDLELKTFEFTLSPYVLCM